MRTFVFSGVSGTSWPSSQLETEKQKHDDDDDDDDECADATCWPTRAMFLFSILEVKRVECRETFRAV